MSMPIDALTTYFFSLDLSYRECEVLYNNSHSSVILTAENGLRVQVPVSRLRTHVSVTGIKGRFRLQIDSNNKIFSFERIA